VTQEKCCQGWQSFSSQAWRVLSADINWSEIPVGYRSIPVERCMMTLDAAYLRERASECRARAQAMTASVVREELLSLADYYDAMARELDARQQSPVPASPIDQGV
jgi:hypothetical protein